MALPGQTRIVTDVPHAFARLVVETSPESVALSGGDLARRCYAALAREQFEWSAVDVYFGDERMVGVDHPDSNEGMARATLLDAAHPRAIHSMVSAGADGYDALIRSAPAIQLVHLGLGPDGHTASLFPGSPALDERDRFVVETGDDLHPQRRLTFTFPAIARAGLAVVTVAGEEKRDAIARIRSGEDLPGARIRARHVLWLGDEAALGEERS